METGVWAAALVLLTGLSLLAGATLGGLRRAAWKNFRLLRGGLALAVGLDVGLLFLLGRRLAGPLLPCAPEADLWLGGACLLAALPLYFCPFSLFPEDSGALVLAGRTQQRRFTACLLRLAAGFLFFGGWLI